MCADRPEVHCSAAACCHLLARFCRRIPSTGMPQKPLVNASSAGAGLIASGTSAADRGFCALARASGPGTGI